MKQYLPLLIIITFISISFITIAQDCGDINLDGSVDIIDALTIAQFYIDLVKKFPC